MAGPTTLHVTYGDVLADALARIDPDPERHVLVVREALRDGPVVDVTMDELDAFVDVRARHLARAHGADESQVAAELGEAWTRIASHPGDVVLHVDADPCVDCAAFLAAALRVLQDAARALARSATGVSIARGGDLRAAVELRPRDVAAGAGAWRMLAAGDVAGLRLAARDQLERTAPGVIADLPELLASRGGS